MGDTNFNRKYLMRAGAMGQSGFVIGDTDPHTLHISFSVEKNTLETSNTSKVQIWNLSPSSLSVLDTEDCVIELQAGYQDHTSLIFVGNVVTVETKLDGADRLTELEVVDGRVELRDTFMTISYVGKVNTKVIFDQISSLMGVSAVYSASCIFEDLQNGFSFVGAAKDALSKLCDACGFSWSMQNHILQIRLPNEPINTRAYVLSPETGLLDIPKRVTLAQENGEASENTTDKKQIGYEVRYLLNGAIGVNDFVRLESRSIKGDFRVDKVSMNGDNLEGEWTCTALLLEVKQ